ncbi:MAG: hypothetical protein RPT25_15485 [Cycloclasticus sp.]
MRTLKVSIFILFYLTIQEAFSLELTAGVISKGRDTIRNEEQKRVSPIIKSVIKNQSGASLARSFGYTNLESGDNWYRFTVDLKIHGVNVETKQYLGNWPLTPWPNSVRMKGEGITWRVRPALSAVKGGEYTEINDPEVQVLGTNKQFKIDSYNPSVGCLSQTPLRYGDVDNNTSNELVLLLNNDLVVFSPVLQKIIFATNLSDSDELKPERVADWFLDEATVNPQFVADSGTNNLIKAALPATRSFAKIYLDDFNADGKKDIIVWRKLYESNLKTNPVLGFAKVADLFVHYSLVDGEYQIQSNQLPVEGEFGSDPAQQAQIKGWLEAKNLTWQKGFPTKSECAEQEGQPIPEMHDPLLNDPDVLK